MMGWVLMGGALMDDELAVDAYIYGFAMVFDLRQVERVAHKGLGSLPPAQFNRFSHATALAGPEDTFVSINNDTIYSMAQVDLSGGPLLLRVPDAAGRYYVLQFVDAWTNNFAYVGRRATGTAAGSFLLTPPGWTGETRADEIPVGTRVDEIPVGTRAGEIPDGTRVIEFPTSVGSIVGRWACAGESDLPAVRALQHELTLEPCQGTVTGKGLPSPEAVPADLAFFEQMRTWMRAFPPSAADRAYQQRFAPLGLLDAVSPYISCPPALAKALADGAGTGQQKIETMLRRGSAAPPVNGWVLTHHVFDYNIDHLELGTIDDPAWKIADRPIGYLVRALAARGGLWGNHGYEAAYPMTYTDADGDQLDGKNRYVLRFEEPPPVDAFWSITMYDLPEFYLVANPINRYSIGDRTPGLRRDDDGSITILIQHERPGDSSNWLPAPPAPFRPIMRLYQPRPAILDGAYAIPPIKKAAR
jgi:hypothetical protein